MQELKLEFSQDDNAWWALGVPKAIRVDIMKLAESDDNKRGNKEAYFNLIDYRKIALENWTLFQNILGYGKKNDSKDRQTKWMVEVNDKRNAIAHASSGVMLSIEELQELTSYSTWLNQRYSYNSDDNTDSAEV